MLWGIRSRVTPFDFPIFYTGFKVNSGEYKLMGLAPYGVPQYSDIIRNNLIHVKND